MKRRASPEETFGDLPILSAIDAEEKRAARERAKVGISTSAKHAEDTAPGWHAQALAAVHSFAISHSDPFLCEQVRAAMPFANVDGRAFGAVMQEAKRLGWIEKAGAGPASSSNLSLKVLWKSRVFVGSEQHA